MAQWEPVIVTWHDAYLSTKNTAKEFTKHKIEPCVRRTIGFMIHDDNDNIVVAGEDDRGALDALDTIQDCDTVTVIPRGMVVRVVELTERRGRRGGDESSNLDQ